MKLKWFFILGPDKISDYPIEIVELLIRHGCNVLARNLNKETPLYIAASTRRLDVVKLLEAAIARQEKSQNLIEGTEPTKRLFEKRKIALYLTSIISRLVINKSIDLLHSFHRYLSSNDMTVNCLFEKL